MDLRDDTLIAVTFKTTDNVTREDVARMMNSMTEFINERFKKDSTLNSVTNTIAVYPNPKDPNDDEPCSSSITMGDPRNGDILADALIEAAIASRQISKGFISSEYEM